MDEGGGGGGLSLGPSSSQARSRSRGRPTSRPGDLLARKQQILASSNLLTGEEGGDAGSGTQARVSRRDRYDIKTSMLSGPSGDDLSAEQQVDTRLESLSELLRHQQQNETTGIGSTAPSTPNMNKSIDDVYILLAKKEKDLQLAGELGKALLEKNEQLSKANERITEDYTQKLELLEQDKHRLKRELDLVTSEYDNRLIELQADCNILRNQCEEQRLATTRIEKEKSRLIDDLVQQNQRLTSELEEATKSEELLSSQLDQANQRFISGRSNRQDHMVQLDALKDEIQLVNQRKQDLERRLRLAQQDKSQLSTELHESGDKIQVLESLLSERDSKQSELISEIDELRDSSAWLSGELEQMICLNERLSEFDISLAAGDEHQRRLAESASARKRSQLIDQLKELRRRTASRLRANQHLLRQQQRSSLSAQSSTGGAEAALRRHRRKSAAIKSSSLRAELNADSLDEQNELDASSDENDDDEEKDDHDDQEHISGRATNVEIFSMLAKFLASLQQRRDALMNSSTSGSSGAGAAFVSPGSTAGDDSGISNDETNTSTCIGATMAGSDRQLSRNPAAWRRMFASLNALIDEMPCATCHLMISERADYEQLQKLHSRLTDQMRRKDDELLKLETLKEEQATRVGQLEERVVQLETDLSQCDMPKEEIVKIAWQTRDQAVQRKNNAEISLAKTRIENMQISSQLMEVVQQKGELSQRLAQFEDDIHYITQHSVMAKFTWEEYAEQVRRSKAKAAAQESLLGVGSSLNPLVSLLGFSLSSTPSSDYGNSSATSNTNHSQITSRDSNNEIGTKNGQQPTKLAQLSSSPTANLMRNLRANKFNLKFWQRNATTSSSSSSSTTSQPDYGGSAPVVDVAQPTPDSPASNETLVASS